MKITTLALAASVLGSLGAGAASAAPIGPNGLQAGSSAVTQVRMDRGERMMKKRMMRKHMMKRHMMHKRMMNRGM